MSPDEVKDVAYELWPLESGWEGPSDTGIYTAYLDGCPIELWPFGDRWAVNCDHIWVDVEGETLEEAIHAAQADLSERVAELMKACKTLHDGGEE